MAGVQDQGPGTGDLSREPMTQLQNWGLEIGQQDWRLGTGEMAVESVEPGKQEVAETQPQEDAAAQELLTAKQEEGRTGGRQLGVWEFRPDVTEDQQL